MEQAKYLGWQRGRVTVRQGDLCSLFRLSEHQPGLWTGSPLLPHLQGTHQRINLCRARCFLWNQNIAIYSVPLSRSCFARLLQGLCHHHELMKKLSALTAAFTATLPTPGFCTYILLGCQSTDTADTETVTWERELIGDIQFLQCHFLKRSNL